MKMNLKVYDHDCYENDIATKSVQLFFENLLKDYDGMWQYREPELKTEGDDISTFTIVSDKLGLIFVKVYSYTDEDIIDVNDRYWTINNVSVRSEILRFRNYTHKIKSKIDDPINDITNEIPIKTLYLFPYIKDSSKFKNLKLAKDESLYCIDFHNISLSEVVMDNLDYNILISIIQNASIINKVSNIYINEPARNIAEAIVLNNKKIAQFDYDQMDASLTITNKAERIRGMAGSGKTVLLAIKAARLHKKYPDKKIAFVFYTKSLYTQTTNLIRKYYYLIADDEPNWNNLKVLHSWGGATTGEGFYSYICKEMGLAARTFSNATYEMVCNELIYNPSIRGIFDFILIDEGQDFPLEFYLLVEKVLREPKKVIIAYDELQTTNEVKIPEFETLFGKTNGVPNIMLEPQYDYILKKSYRNNLNVLLTAFSFGFGFYHNITQIIQDEVTWRALGFDIQGKLESKNEIIVYRPKENSPNSTTDFFPSEVPVYCTTHKNIREVVDDISEKINWLIEDQKVDPMDILVIDIKMNKSNTLSAVQLQLDEYGIQSHIPGLVSDARDFFKDGKVTLSTPRNAKGNEVPIVFVVGCEDIYDKEGIVAQRQARNFMFISITRSKGWVYLYAVGRVKGVLSKEFNDINDNIPYMKFEYPTEDKIKELGKINFLVNNPKARVINNNVEKIKNAVFSDDSDVVKALLDLDPEFKNKLKEILGD
jgi:superfamily I DNA and RNA helicase